MKTGAKMQRIMPFSFRFLLFTFVVLPQTAFSQQHSLQWSLQARLEGEERVHHVSNNGDRLGRSVSISGATIVAGAHHDTMDTAVFSGSAAVFEQRRTMKWQLKKGGNIRPEKTASNDNFGNAIAIDGDTMVVGAEYRNARGLNSGAAFVFRRGGKKGTWEQQAVLSPIKSASDDHLGTSVDIQGSTIVLGAPYHNFEESLSEAGVAYVFELGDNGWVESATLKASDASIGSLFGRSVAIDGDTIVVGASGRSSDNQTVGAGASYVFRRNEGKIWTEEAILLPSNVQAGQDFGISVDVSGERVVVGAPRDNSGGSNAGAAFVFHRENQTVWRQAAKLVSSDGEPRDQFGISVAIDAEAVAVGAYLDDKFENKNVGSVQIFRMIEGIWNFEAKLTPCDGRAGDSFGYAVDIQGNLVVVGSFGSESLDKYSESGAIYVFKRTTKRRSSMFDQCGTTGLK